MRQQEPKSQPLNFPLTPTVEKPVDRLLIDGIQDECSPTMRADEDVWHIVQALLAHWLGQPIVGSWFDRVGVAGIESGEARLAAPTKFIAGEINKRFGDDLLRAWKLIDPRVLHVRAIAVELSISGRGRAASGSSDRRESGQ